MKSQRLVHAGIVATWDGYGMLSLSGTGYAPKGHVPIVYPSRPLMALNGRPDRVSECLLLVE